MGLRTMLQKHPKTGVYYFRKRYPFDVAGEAGKAEFKRSLNTKNRKEADVRVVEAERDFNKRILALRNKKLIPQEDLHILRNTLVGLNLIHPDSAEITLDTIYSARASVKERLVMLRDMSKADTPHIKKPQAVIAMSEEVLNELAEYEKMFLEPGFSPSNRKRHVTENLEHYREALTEALNQPTAKVLPLPPKVIPSHKKTLDYAYDAWKSARNPGIQSATEWKRAVKLFNELHGELSVEQIAKQHVKEFREAIRIVPTGLTREQLKMPLPQLVTLAKKKELTGKPRTAGAVNKLIVALSAIFDVMCDEDMVKENPAKGLLLKAEDSNRLPYSIDDLNKLFHSPIYVRPYAISDNRPSRFWLPILALYTGARIGELSQARVEDIIQKGELVYLSINTLHEGKRLKTKSSRREVPLHNMLIKTGLMRYVAHAKKTGAKLLFPDLTLTTHGGYASIFSKQYRIYCREIGLVDPNKVFHSFRHSFKDACREAEIPKDVHDRLTGHASADVGSGYGLGYSVEKLNQYVQRIEYAGLNLEHLYI